MQRYLWIGTLSLIWSLAGRAGENPAEKKPDVPLRFESETTSNDPPDAVKASPAKVHVVPFVKGRAYIIDLVSTDFDAFLRLDDARGKQLAQDDDSGGKANARLRFTAPADGKYRLIATAYDQKSGRYVLTVQPPPPALDLNRVHIVPADGISTTGELVEGDPRDRVSEKGS